jgi:hypothetical protein
MIVPKKEKSSVQLMSRIAFCDELRWEPLWAMEASEQQIGMEISK